VIHGADGAFEFAMLRGLVPKELSALIAFAQAIERGSTLKQSELPK